MGWSFSCDSRVTKQDTINECSKGWETENCKVECLAKSVRGNELWVVFQSTVKKTGKIDKGIVLFLLSRQGGTWGYKDITEGMGPYYFKCPITFLKMTADYPELQNKTWREGVKEYHAKERAKRQAKKRLSIEV